MDGSFTPYVNKGKIKNKKIGNYVKKQIVAKLPGYPNILKGVLYILLIAIKYTKTIIMDTFIFNRNYPLPNHVRYPSSQYNHLGKLLIANIINSIHFPTTI